jgi:hypothetical protein
MERRLVEEVHVTIFAGLREQSGGVHVGLSLRSLWSDHARNHPNLRIILFWKSFRDRLISLIRNQSPPVHAGGFFHFSTRSP